MTYIGRAITITGTIESTEPIRIAGTVNGAVLAADTDVVVEPGARIRGPITGRSITLRGATAGRLIARDVVRIERTARVRANVASPRFALEDGAWFRGAVEPGRTDAALIVLEYRTRTEARQAADAARPASTGGGHRAAAPPEPAATPDLPPEPAATAPPPGTAQQRRGTRARLSMD